MTARRCHVFYQTQYTDPTTGDVLAQSRWYSPGTGTFRSRDTYAGNLNTPVSLNRYTYAHNNPIRYSDPSGRCIELWVEACENAGVFELAETQFQDNFRTIQTTVGSPALNASVTQYRWEPETAVATATDLMIAAGYGLQSCVMSPGSYCDSNIADQVQGSNLPFEYISNDTINGSFSVDNPATLQYFGPDLSLEQITGPQAFRDLVFDYEACGIGGDFSAGWCGFEAATMVPALKIGKGFKLGKGLTFAGRVAAMRTGLSGAGHVGAAQLDELFQSTRALCSFAGETGVLMANGTVKSISEVEIGDMVIAFDPESGERGEREVTALWVHQDTLVDLEIGASTVTTTEDHPFWNHTDQQWQRADQLDSGDYVLTADGDLVAVEGINPASTYNDTAYNLTIDDIHTYFVGNRDTQILVHNICDHIVLGLDDFGLRETAQKVGGRHLLGDLDFQRTVLAGARNPDVRFTVALDGLAGSNTYDQVIGAVENGLIMGGAGSYTNWELATLGRYGRLPDTTFVRGGVKVPNPFAIAGG